MKIAFTRKYAYFTSLIVLVAALGATGYGLYWSSTRLHARAAAISRLGAEQQALTQEVKSARDAASELASYDDLREKLAEVVPSEKNQSNIIGELLALAEKNSVTFTSISFADSKLTPTNGKIDQQSANTSQSEPVKDIAGVNSIAISVTFSTNYQNLLSLKSIENNQRIIQIKNIDIQTGELDVYEINLNLVTYIRL